jgi:hypothetical protein
MLVGSAMVRLRALALAGALVLAAVVNVFFAPEIYSPRAPAFSGADLAANEAWRGHAFSFQPSWLAATLPNSTFVNVRTGLPDWAPDDGHEIGIMWEPRTVTLENLVTDNTDFPLDLSGFDIRDQVADHHQLFALIRCQSDPIAGGQDFCDYFVAFDDTVNPDDALTFVGVFTVTGSETNEVGFIEKGLLERLVGRDVTTLPTIGEEPQ